jgi:hypothetical protein
MAAIEWHWWWIKIRASKFAVHSLFKPRLPVREHCIYREETTSRSMSTQRHISVAFHILARYKWSVKSGGFFVVSIYPHPHTYTLKTDPPSNLVYLSSNPATPILNMLNCTCEKNMLFALIWKYYNCICNYLLQYNLVFKLATPARAVCTFVQLRILFTVTTEISTGDNFIKFWMEVPGGEFLQTMNVRLKWKGK